MKSIKLVWLIAFTLVSFFSAQATIRPVPGQYARIQHAVDFANDGDTILIAPGVYTGKITREVLILSKGLTILGDGDASSVIIDCLGSPNTRGFHIENSTSGVHIANITLFRASANYFDFDSSIFDFNGGGIKVLNSQLSIANCRFLSNYAGDFGGAIHAENSIVEVNSCSFDSCHGGSGAAIFLIDCSSCSIVSSSFVNGYATSAAGAIFAFRSQVRMENCEFTNNYAWISPFWNGGYGGAIYTEQGTLKIGDCRFFDNSTHAGGGAVYCWNSALELDRSLFANNHISCNSSSGGKDLLDDGGALYSNGGNCSITSCTFVDNRTGCGGSAVYVAGQTSTINQCIIAASDTAYAFEGNASFSCTNIFGNAGGDWTGSIASQLGQNGNISEDPLFCGAFPGDYRLNASSPCAAANNSCAVTMGSEAVGCDVLCGDPNLSGAVTISDAVFLIEYIFANGEPPAVMQTGDVDCSGTVNISDVVYLLNYIFSGGLTPCNACP